MKSGLSTAIVEYDRRYGDAFLRLNCEWLEKYFRVEPIDRVILADPESTIIQPGGVILYVLQSLRSPK